MTMLRCRLLSSGRPLPPRLEDWTPGLRGLFLILYLLPPIDQQRDLRPLLRNFDRAPEPVLLTVAAEIREAADRVRRSYVSLWEERTIPRPGYGELARMISAATAAHEALAAVCAAHADAQKGRHGPRRPLRRPN